MVVSITTDLHIKKGVYRPHIPEDLRALNLAAFEMVDYVIIDSNETPLKNIKILKPDLFAKGFEYVRTAYHQLHRRKWILFSPTEGRLFLLLVMWFILLQSLLIKSAASKI